MKKSIVIMAILLLTFLGIWKAWQPVEEEYPASFVRDTLVHTPDGLVRIEDLSVGDYVISYHRDRQEWDTAEILQVNASFHDIIAMTTIQMGQHSIISTGHHPIYVTDGDGLKDRILDSSNQSRREVQGWVQAGFLERGDRVLSYNGEEIEIGDVFTTYQSSLLYDLEIEGSHTFLVGEPGILAGDITLVPEDPFEISYDYDDSGFGFCFPQGTIVKSAENTAIEEIQKGDLVRSYDPLTEQWQWKQVINTFAHDYNGLMLSIQVNQEVLDVTANHPFFVLSGENLSDRPVPSDIPSDQRISYPQGQWVSAQDLRLGDVLLSEGGIHPIEKIEKEDRSLRVYNLEVAHTHSYSVGDLGLVVHNKGSMDMAKESSAPMEEEMMGLYDMHEASSMESDDVAPRQDESVNLSGERVQEEKLYLSADDSNSCASPVIVRNRINQGRYVDPSLVRTYEFYNYYNFGYPAPEEGDIGLYANMKQDSDHVYSIQAVLRSPDRTMDQLPPMNVVFLLDSSGSMGGSSWDISKEFIYRYIEFLRPIDTFALVTVDRYAEVQIAEYQVDSRAVDQVRNKLDSWIPDDITNLDPGIAQAYHIAEEFQKRPGITRVIFISDGGANAGDFTGQSISAHAADQDRQGIYLCGVGVGSGFNDGLMDMLTDSGRGAYFFLDSKEEISRILDQFLSYFDLAYKDIRLAMELPIGWSVQSFHGEQISTVREDIVPQYLAPNDQMIFHMELNHDGQSSIEGDTFHFEAEYTPIGGNPQLKRRSFSVDQLNQSLNPLIKANAITAFAEGLKAIQYPLEPHREDNLTHWADALSSLQSAQSMLNDPELTELLELAQRYRMILDKGEQFPGSRDLTQWDIPSTLGIPEDSVIRVKTRGPATQQAIVSLERLGSSVRLQPTQGYRFLGLSSGPVGNPQPVGSGQLSSSPFNHPIVQYMGMARYYMNQSPVYDHHSIELRLRAPQNAQSFSFDVNYFSAEYPDFINQNFNDSFYAIIEAGSINNGEPTNISFDPEQNPLEVDNNYFQRRFHPIPNKGTGFDYNGSTGWLRTSWPIRGGEEFTLTFSIHDEGDAIYDSLVLLDNFQWHEYPVLGNTDPLN